MPRHGQKHWICESGFLSALLCSSAGAESHFFFWLNHWWFGLQIFAAPYLGQFKRGIFPNFTLNSGNTYRRYFFWWNGTHYFHVIELQFGSAVWITVYILLVGNMNMNGVKYGRPDYWTKKSPLFLGEVNYCPFFLRSIAVLCSGTTPSLNCDVNVDDKLAGALIHSVVED